MRSPSTTACAYAAGEPDKGTGTGRHAVILVHRPPHGLRADASAEADEEAVGGSGEVAGELVHRPRRRPPSPRPRRRARPRLGRARRAPRGARGRALGGGVPDPPGQVEHRGDPQDEEHGIPAGGQAAVGLAHARRRRARPSRSAAPRRPTQTRWSRQRSAAQRGQRQQPQRRLHREALAGHEGQRDEDQGHLGHRGPPAGAQREQGAPRRHAADEPDDREAGDRSDRAGGGRAAGGPSTRDPRPASLSHHAAYGAVMAPRVGRPRNGSSTTADGHAGAGEGAAHRGAAARCAGPGATRASRMSSG